VAIRRELAEAYPDRYRPYLARSLSNLGNRLSALGRPAEALPPTQEAVALYRELAETYPDRYRPHLARSLSNLGVWFFSALGRVSEAKEAKQEAERLREYLE
jgi:tetratricopeptide (TPR) repeat protein